MPVPWLAVGSLVLGNLDKIMSVVRPAFTRKQIETLDTQTDLLNQQIAELQAAAAANAEQIKVLAAQLKDVVAALEQAAVAAASERRQHGGWPDRAGAGRGAALASWRSSAFRPLSHT